ncbi:MAG: hypothetical protein WCY05_04525 [Candidatus Omnitrophota bacterium]
MKFTFKSLVVFFFLFSVFFFQFSIFTLPSSNAYAEVPRLINYQGRLTDSSGTPLNGSYEITFRIYDAETAGTLLWTEVQPGVVVDKGIFSILLGSVTSLNLAFDGPYFLEIKVGTEVMTSRQKIATAAYAMTAQNAVYATTAANGVPTGVILMWSGAVANIPAGWALCNGANGTPDLRNRFVVGAGSSYAVAASGGEATHALTIAEMPAHTHGMKYSTPSSNGGGGFDDASGSGYKYTESVGGSQSHNNLPPYYALCYIMKK